MWIKSIVIFIVSFCALSCLYAMMAGERAYLFHYCITIKDIPAQAKEIKVWVPYPASNSYQEVEDLSAEEQPVYSGLDRAYGNKMLFYVINSPKEPVLTIDRVYKIKRREFLNRSLPSEGNKYPLKRFPQSELKKYISEDGFVVITDYVRRLAARITKGKESEIEKARAIYDFLFERMAYDKSLPGWGRGDVERACLLWSGNCTDFHSLFIAFCRACGIPAKFVIGVSVPKEDKGSYANYHCWAEFYAPRYGWVPVDISEAWKDKSKQDYFFGAVDENRIEFSHGRGIKLDPFQKGRLLNYFVFPHVEIDGEEFENVETAFSYQDIAKNEGR